MGLLRKLFLVRQISGKEKLFSDKIKKGKSYEILDVPERLKYSEIYEKSKEYQII